LAVANYGLGDFEKPTRCSPAPPTCSVRIGAGYHRQITLASLGDEAFYGRGDIPKATSYYQQGNGLARQIGEPASTARCLERMTEVALSSGDVVRAETYDREAVWR